VGYMRGSTAAQSATAPSILGVSDIVVQIDDCATQISGFVDNSGSVIPKDSIREYYSPASNLVAGTLPGGRSRPFHRSDRSPGFGLNLIAYSCSREPRGKFVDLN
jgi:hypothetical protein